MSDLAPQKINLSFGGLLQIPGGLTASLQSVTDGNGVTGGLQISTTGFSGTVISDTVTITGGTINGTAIGATNPSSGRFSSLTVSTLTGLLKGSSGVVSTATANTDYLTPPSGTAILKANSGGALANATSGVDYAPATSGSSILKGNGSGGFTNAVSGTDYAPATSGTSILYGNGSGGFSLVTVGSGLQFIGGTLASTSGGGSVTTVSIVSANGFTGTVANASSTPAITLATSITGLLKGNGTAISAATSGTDYAPATSGTAILKGNGAGGFSSAIASTDYAVPTSGTSILYGNGSGGFNNATIGSGLSFSAGTLSATEVMTYPGAGIAISTGSAWGTSKTTPTGDVVGTSDSQTLTNKTLLASGTNIVEATSGPTSSQLAGNRNKIINGAMMIDQRNAGASVTVSNGLYITDRFKGYTTTGVYTGQQVSDAPAGFTKSLKLTVTSAQASLGAGDYYALIQNIEGNNIADLNWGTANAASVTLSFWVKSSLTGTFSWTFQSGTGFTTYVGTFTISAANTWQKITVSIAGPTTGTWATDNNTGIFFCIGLGNGSTYSTSTVNQWTSGNVFSATGQTNFISTTGATFYITGVQLEKGATATPFENRLYGTELALCQRYYQQLGGASYGVTYQPYAVGSFINSTQASLQMNLFTIMRTSPTFGFSGLSYVRNGGSALAVSSAAIDISSPTTIMYNCFVTGATAGSGTAHYQNNTNASALTLSAEL